jgi:hypothetical protein
MVRRVVTIVGLCVITATAVSAQPPPGGPPVAAPTDAMSPAQLHQLFDAMLVMQAQNALSLNEQQYGQFLTRLRVLQESRRKNLQERGRLINELQKMTNPRNPQAAPEADVKSRLGELQELEARTAAELRRAYNGIDEVLSPLQQARFRVLEEQIERRKLELVARARLNNQQNRQNQPRPPARRPPGRH